MNNTNDNTADQGTPPVALMITEGTHPSAVAIARLIAAMPEEHERRVNEVKEAAKAQLAELDKEFQKRHDENWTALQNELGLANDPNYSLCTDHMDAHGVVFITEQRETNRRSMPGGIDIGRMIAEALGRNGTDARVISEDDSGGVIEVKI